jgi:predicted acylesterase/phospholipase RssA
MGASATPEGRSPPARRRRRRPEAPIRLDNWDSGARPPALPKGRFDTASASCYAGVVTVRRDVALVLSGGGMNGVLMELGFLRRVRESSYWPRVGWIFGTSAGALSGALAAVDRLDELEAFLLTLRPEDTFRPHRLWQLPLFGLHDYVLPRTIDERLSDRVALGRDLAAAEVELVVVATDVTDDADDAGTNPRELAYSSRETAPEIFAQAVLASAAISALVLPLRVGDRIATDGGWVRNYPLGYAYDHPEVEMIIGFRYLPRYPPVGVGSLTRLRQRLERFRRVPPIRGFITELVRAEQRAALGEPAHLVDMIVRLMRVSMLRNNALEERFASEKDESIAELQALREDVLGLVREHVRGSRRQERMARAVDERFAAARFPFRHDRLVPRITVHAACGEVSLDPGFRNPKPWTEAAKRALIARGYHLADRELVRRDESAA